MKVFSRHLVPALFFLLFGLFFLVSSMHLPSGDLREPSSGFWPLTVSIYLIVFIVIFFFKHQHGNVKLIAAEGVSKSWPVAVFLITLIVYMFVLNTLGFFLSTCLLLFTLFRIMGFRSIFYSLLTAFFSSLAFTLFFGLLFEIPLPKGLL